MPSKHDDPPKVMEWTHYKCCGTCRYFMAIPGWRDGECLVEQPVHWDEPVPDSAHQQSMQPTDGTTCPVHEARDG